MHATAVRVSAGSSFAPTCSVTATTRWVRATSRSRAACDPSPFRPAAPNPTSAESAPEHARLIPASASPVRCTNAFDERWHQFPFSPRVPGS
jgi:hypothetical protein